MGLVSENWEVMVLVGLIAGMLVSAVYSIPIMLLANSQTVVNSTILTFSVMIVSLLVAAVLLIKHKSVYMRLGAGAMSKRPRDPAEIKQEIGKIKNDLAALETIAKDGLMKPNEFEKNKSMLEARIRKKEKELSEVSVEKGQKAASVRSPIEVRRELSGLYRDLGALKILSKDSLMKPEDIKERQDLLQAEVKKKKSELRNLERKERQKKKQMASAE